MSFLVSLIQTFVGIPESASASVDASLDAKFASSSVEEKSDSATLCLTEELLRSASVMQSPTDDLRLVNLVHGTRIVAAPTRGKHNNHRLHSQPRTKGYEAREIYFVNTNLDGKELIGLYERTTNKIYKSPNQLFTKGFGLSGGRGYDHLFYLSDGMWISLKSKKNASIAAVNAVTASAKPAAAAQ